MEHLLKQNLLLQEKILNNLSEEPYFICKDHTVSQKQFELRYNSELDMMVTFPAPEVSELPEFYKSEAYISHTDSKKSVFDKIYQGVKRHMLNRKLRWIEKEKVQPGRILDIGAGTGDFLARAEKKGWEISGVEPSAGARELASKKGILLADNSEGFPSDSFDVITLWHVLEHVPNLEKQIQELDRLLKKDGILIVAVPNFKSFDAYKYKNEWAGFDVPRHLWHFSRNSIERIFTEFSFELVKVEPLKFDSYYVSLLSENNSGKNPFGFVKGLFNGLLSNSIARKTKEYSSVVYFLQKSSENRK